MDTDNKHLLNRICSTISPGIVLLFMLILICIAYSNSLYSPLVLDDRNSFVEDPNVYVKDFSISSLKQLSHTRFGTKRLIPMISFALDHHIGMGSIIQFHITNIIVHIAATCFLYFFLTGIVKTDTGAKAVKFIEPRFFCLFITVLWAFHPIQTNCVTYIVQRMASMAALFYLASLAFYIHARINRFFVTKIFFFPAALITAALAFMSKENSFTLPVAILLVELFFISPNLAQKIQKLMKWHYWLILIIIILALLPLGENYLNSILNGYNTRHFTLPERLLTQSRIVIFYISLLLLPLPHRLNLDHDIPLSHSLLSPPTTLLSLFLLGSLLVIGIRAKKTNPFITFGILWFFLNLIIESSVVPLELIFEHRLYLPSAGFFTVMVSLADRACNRLAPDNPQTIRNIFLLAMIITSCLLSTLTTIRNHVWRDPVSLWGDCAKKSPDKARPIITYGAALIESGSYDEALAALDKGIALGEKHREEYIVAVTNITSIHFIKGEFEEARRRGEECLDTITTEFDGSGFPKLALNLARTYGETDEQAKSFKILAKGFALYPEAAYLLKAMEIMLTEVYNSTDETYEKLKLTGEPVEAPLIIALLLLDLRQYEKCATYLEKALEIDSDHPESLETKKKLLQKLQENAKAVHLSDIHNDQDFKNNRMFRTYMSLADFILNNYSPLKFMVGGLVKRAMEIMPDNPFAHVYMARRHMEMGHMEKALSTIEKSISDNSDFPPLLEIAGLCYIKIGKPYKAAIVYQHLLELYHGHPAWRNYSLVVQKSVLNDSLQTPKQLPHLK